MPSLEIIEYNSPEYYQALNLRSIHLREPLGLELTADETALDKDGIHIACKVDERIVACLILQPILDRSKVIQIRQMIVDPDYREQGLGEELIIFAEKYILEHGYARVILETRKEAFRFYQKYGYEVDDEEFLKLNIPHYKMQKSFEF